jgi:phosphate transport system permease protein
LWLVIASLLTLTGCVGLIAFAVLQAWPVIDQSTLSVMLGSTWRPATGDYGMLPLVTGSVLVAALSVALSAPVALVAAGAMVFLTTPSMRSALIRTFELLSAIPSVIYGAWGLSVVVPMILAWNTRGISLLAGVLVVSAMLLPTMIVHMGAGFSQLAPMHRNALASGLHPVRALWSLHFYRGSEFVLSAVTLAIGRALGETIAVLMVVGNVPQVPNSILDPIRTLTGSLALEMAYASGEHRNWLFASACLLFLLVLAVMAMSGIVRILSSRSAQ